MSEAKVSGVRGGSGRGGWLGRAMVAVLAVGAAAVLYVIGSASIKPDDGHPEPLSQSAVSDFARGELARLQTPPVKRPPPETAFTGPDGAPVTLAAFKGRVTVVNLWATWCPPCVTEMPSLARLQQAYPDGDVQVVPVSIDGPRQLEKARAFIGENAPLRFHHSAEAAIVGPIAAKGFPTTIIYDKAGFERARLERPAEWDSPEVKRLLDRLLADPA
jgi:thiol-disulfide isomerase/thioredoxin